MGHTATAETYRAILDHSTDLIAVLDEDGVIVDANRRWEDLVEGPLRGRHITEFAADGAAEANIQGFRTSIAPQGISGSRGSIRGRDGRTLHIEFSNHVMEDHGQRIVVSIGRDVTARVEADQARAASEQRLQAVLARLPDVVWSAGADGTIRFISDNVERVCGFTAEQLHRGGVPLWIESVHPEDLPTSMAAFDDMLAGTIDSFDIEYRLRRPDGRWIWIRSRTSKRYVADGMVHIDGLVSDVTERRRLEENLRQAQKMEAIGLLAGGIAHDFNNHLAVITADCGSLAMELAENDPRREEVREIEDAALRAGALIRQLLVFSRSRRAQPEDLAIDALVADLGRMLRRVIGEDIAMELKLPETPRLRVRIDRTELEQVILNLAINARDAMPRGGRLTIAVAEHDDQVNVVVADTGEGMSTEVRARIFEPFFTTKAVGRGTGLGLSTVYAIIDGAGGSIAVESAPGAGTTFVLRLPAIRSIKATRRKTAPAPLRGTERVLLVEDDPAVRAATARILRASGYDVVEAEDAFAAIAIAKEDTKLAIVVSDVVMPLRSGPELIEDLRTLRPGLPWLLVSGYSEHTALPDELVHDTTRFLAKPFLPDELRRRVRGLIDAAVVAA